MALVSISEASRLTNKSRTTVHRYISKGKLSICTDENGVKKIDTSELLRVFGAFKAVHHEQIDNVTPRRGLKGKTYLRSYNPLLREYQLCWEKLR